MAELRLIDANALEKEVEESLCANPHTGIMAQTMHTHEHKHFLCMIFHQTTIDPETLPIVRELREELERVTAERDAIKRDIEEAMKISELEFPGFLCEFCAKNPFCVKCNGPEWRGAQKEE